MTRSVAMGADPLICGEGWKPSPTASGGKEQRCRVFPGRYGQNRNIPTHSEEAAARLLRSQDGFDFGSSVWQPG